MKRAAAIIVILVGILALGSSQDDCNRDECPPSLCADPVRADGQCCETCENSSCNYRGCVYFGPFGPQWYPDPCMLCSCRSGEEVCAAIDCPVPECFGFPLVTDPNACCPRCDWGIGDDECAPVPARNVSLYATLGDGAQCQYEVTVHDCDKPFLSKNGEIFECIGKKRAKRILTEDCVDIRKVILEDTTKCIVRRPRAPIADLDLNPNLCAIRVP